ncbi:structural cement protein Gp24 [Entomomonas asaccharolytica]|uniref:Uncharacterized protein n=1 Tax=Entomomonas asaccharolytica TaxID=2785331 RepID=A0A974NI22_9GAMM|nr:hypothetical protein [Entomomonas asaccharolytica]QQP86937.1 hypothetical protein JHT90_06745 [Entomomonas asaccharolytica]
MGFTNWDSDDGIFNAGSIKRVSSSDQKVWGEKNATDTQIEYGLFVAVAAEGGVKPITAGTDLISGIVVRDIYGEKSTAEKTINVVHISHGDSVAVQSVDGIDFARGDRAYIVVTGADAGKVTNVKEGAIDIGGWVEDVSAGNNCVAFTLGYIQSFTDAA